MSDTPNFGELLAPVIGPLPPPAVPALLAGLERAAAARYRVWAEAAGGDARDVLLACAAREDEIATRIDALFPVSDADRAEIDAVLPRAVDTFLGVFEGHDLDAQLAIQADAELQGAQAWQGIASQNDDAALGEALAACSALEVETSQAVRKLLERRTAL